MAQAKKPADHKPKSSLDPDTSVTVAVDGRQWTVDRAALVDWNTLEDVGELDSGNITRAPSLLRALLGDQQYALAKSGFGRGPESLQRGSEFAAALMKAVTGASAPNSPGSLG